MNDRDQIQNDEEARAETPGSPRNPCMACGAELVVHGPRIFCARCGYCESCSG